MAMAVTAAATAIDAGSPRFRRILDGVDTAPFKAELIAADALWDLDTSRQDGIAAHRATETIFLRCADRLASDLPTRDVQTSRFTPQARRFPALLRFLQGIADGLDGELGRVLVIRLRPGGRVGVHVDAGAYYAARHRYHLVLSAPGGSRLVCGDESAVLREGELWWFDNKAPHSAENPGDTCRIHVVFDVRSRRIAPDDPVDGPAGPGLAAVPAFGGLDLLGGLDRFRARVSDRLRRARIGPEAWHVRRRLRARLCAHAVIRAADRTVNGPTDPLAAPLQSRSGRPWAWMIDTWPVLLDGRGLRLAAAGFWLAEQGHGGPDPVQLAGPALSAAPLIAGIVAAAPDRRRSAHGLIVRTDRPEHGTRRRIEGRITTPEAVLVDDLLNSGRSLEVARTVLQAHGVTCRRAFCLVDFRSAAGLAWRDRAGVSVTALFSLQELGLPSVSAGADVPV